MLSNHPNCLGGNGPSASSDLIGDVDGPASATDNAVARFDGTTGTLIQNSTVTIADTTGDIAGATSLTSPASTNLTLGTTSFGTALTVASATGNVSIASTTAASSNAGALVVTGGISAGQSAQASYFGGSISFPSDKGIVSSVNDGRLFLDGSANQNGGSIILYGETHGSFPKHTIYAADAHVYKNIIGTQQLSLSLTAATFAGAVAIGNTVNTVSPTSPNRTVTMVVNGVTLYLAAKTTND